MQFKPRPDRRHDSTGPANVKSAAAAPAGATIHPIGVQAVVHALRAAAEMAGFAPSILDSQPWRWRLTGNTLALYLDRACIDHDVDVDGRLAIISCGAALHHARIALAAAGWRLTMNRRPDPADPDRLASLRLEERSLAEPAGAALMSSIPLRRTDRTPVTGVPIAAAQLKAVTSAVRAEETSLHVLYPDEVLELARVASGGLPVPSGSGDRSIGVGPAGLADGRGATFALLYGHTDEPEDWLRAGEALSAGWLTATAAGVSVLPLSAAVEVLATRQAVQIMIGCVGYPYLLLRLGHATMPPSGPRRARAAQVIDRR
ncbi:nitroreductase [Dactylosporangium roseum]|uniref:Nitroreductase n=1 Tax=Dactylosporangium roseum TaxID=47989 RepID=A0ABY5Z4D8_9ACTN|nr:nitroreductase [Dactylosporangium roseum]UWZ36421.1 nitroreductase [Dactylosporangium roseum]